MKKTISALALSFTLTFGISNFDVEAASPFSDLSEKHGGYKDAVDLYDLGILKGYPNGTYGPGNKLTRAQGAAIIGRALNLDVSSVDPENLHFKDIDSKTSGYEYIQKLTEMGVFSKAEKFNPQEPLTRAQMSKVLVNSFNLEGESNRGFRDMPKSHWAHKNVKTLVSTGITHGTTKLTFSPNNPVSRIQMASFVNRALKYSNGSDTQISRKELKVVNENIYQSSDFSYEIVGDSIVFEFHNVDEDLDYNFINFCVHNDPSFQDYTCEDENYSHVLFRDEVVAVPFRDNEYFTMKLSKKNISSNRSVRIVDLDIANENNEYLSPSFIVNTDHQYVQRLLSTKFKGHEKWSTEKKSEEINEYIVTNYKYDQELFDRLEETWFNYPDFNKMEKEKIGICYDLAALHTALLREMGVPAKLEIGYATANSGKKSYHAWTSFEVNGERKIVDVTWALYDKKHVYRDHKNYEADYVY